MIIAYTQTATIIRGNGVRDDRKKYEQCRKYVRNICILPICRRINTQPELRYISVYHCAQTEVSSTQRQRKWNVVLLSSKCRIWFFSSVRSLFGSVSVRLMLVFDDGEVSLFRSQIASVNMSRLCLLATFCSSSSWMSERSGHRSCADKKPIFTFPSGAPFLFAVDHCPSLTSTSSKRCCHCLHRCKLKLTIQIKCHWIHSSTLMFALVFWSETINYTGQIGAEKTKKK